MNKELIPNGNGDGSPGAGNGRDPLDNVIASSPDEFESIARLQVGMVRMGYNRAIQSGATEPRQEDIEALTNHATSIAHSSYCETYDPENIPHDRMAEEEYRKTLNDRTHADAGVRESAANARDAEARSARTPKAGERPRVRSLLIGMAVGVVSLSVAPTLHDVMYATIPDEALSWFFSLASGACIGGFIAWAIFHGRGTGWRWAGLVAGAVIGVGLGIVRLASAGSAGGFWFSVGLTTIELGVVILSHWYATGVHHREDLWEARRAAELEAVGASEAAHAEHARWVEELQRINAVIAAKIAYVADRHARGDLARLVETLVRPSLDGYNAGVAVNRGHVLGVTRRVA
jgi:hypothetical protein